MVEDTVATERWLPVVDYEGLYEVSDAGRVRRVGYAPRVIKPGYGGYVEACLSKRRRKTKYRLHTLVLEAFVCRRPDGMEALHGNGIASDNRLANLRWGTPSGNAHDRVRHGNHPNTQRTHCPREHLLAEPNLDPCSLRNGFRNCYACSLTHKRQRYALSQGYLFDFDTEVALRYAKLMGLVSDEPRQHCNRGHRYTPTTMSVERNGSRRCLTCKNDARRKQPKG